MVYGLINFYLVVIFLFLWFTILIQIWMFSVKILTMICFTHIYAGVVLHTFTDWNKCRKRGKWKFWDPLLAREYKKSDICILWHFWVNLNPKKNIWVQHLVTPCPHYFQETQCMKSDFPWGGIAGLPSLFPTDDDEPFIQWQVLTRSKKESTNIEQARKPQCYASSNLWLTDLLTGVKCRATSVAKNHTLEQ